MQNSAANLRTLLLAALAGLAGYYLYTQSQAPPTQPAPNTRPVPQPTPQPQPQPKPAPAPRPCPGPWDCRREAGGQPETSVEAQVSGGRNADGTEIDCDLPADQQLKNVGGSDGAGLCVFTSITHSARWQNVEVLKDFQAWMRQHPGGGWPKKVDQMIAAVCQQRGVPVPPYVQVEGADLEILKAACAAGRMPGVTYSFSPTGRYGGRRISHMVSLPHADDRWFVVLDNNFPGSENYEWMTPAEFSRTYAPGWAVVLLSPAPPPPPHN